MIRAILSVVASYIVMVVFVVAGLMGLYAIMGPDKAFEPGAFSPSMMWILVSFAVGLVAAIVGGAVCAKIAGSPKPPMALAVVVLGIGLLVAIQALLVEEPEVPAVRPADMSAIDAMKQAQTPAWVALANPLIGVVGVVIGSGLVKKPEPMA